MNRTHGGLDYRTLLKEGLKPEDIIDFSVSINPYEIPSRVKESVIQADLTRYPDTGASLLKREIAAFHSCREEAILCVPGISAVIYSLAHCFISPGDRVVISGPTYCQYENASRLNGAEVIFVNSTPEKGFDVPVKVISETILREKPRLFWICNPNNPTGTQLCEEEFLELVKVCQKSGTLMIVDEAYVSFSPLRYRTRYENVVCLRSMTKDFGIPGLRVGYILGPEEVISRLDIWQPEWSLGEPSLSGGTACFHEIESYRLIWEKMEKEKKLFTGALNERGWDIHPSMANFFLMDLKEREVLEALKVHLWKYLIQVRDCASFHLPSFLRLGVLTPSENRKFIEALDNFSF